MDTNKATTDASDMRETTVPFSDQQKEQLAEEALHWLVMLTSGEADQMQRNLCQRWRRQSSTHEQAFQQARQIWLSLGQSDVLQQYQYLDYQSSLLDSHHPMYVQHMQPLVYFFCYSAYRYVAAVLLAIAIVLFAYLQLTAAPQFRTDFGEMTVFDLDANNQVTLNTNSILSLPQPPQHQLVLHHGEALFKMASQAISPFMIYADNLVVHPATARFSIKKNDFETKITVVAGQVKINHGQQQHVLYANQQLVHRNGSTQNYIQHIDAQQDISWTQGKLYFSQSTVYDVLHQLSQYDTRKWVLLLDPQLQNSKINTTVHIAELDQWLDNLEQALPIRQKKLGPFIVFY
ncbi:FecR family protein [Acinetobacter larvae]|uniref:FecR protein domain-containing protein n=1 Tax=Acinetobacter larvae TaxID=1789224 RepID=A0A1B2M0B5_9GAMM|nr:DUF4880 domain-containing protein [Acinetobacter larvae]AOA58620.1 hypothetical protein BFG52_09825 [Acinetobacter larvae]